MKIERFKTFDLCSECGAFTYNMIVFRRFLQTFCICGSCFNQLKKLEIPKEQVWEYQYLYKVNGICYITEKFYTNHDEVTYSFGSSDLLILGKIEQSKREREG